MSFCCSLLINFSQHFFSGILSGTTLKYDHKIAVQVVEVVIELNLVLSAAATAHAQQLIFDGCWCWNVRMFLKPLWTIQHVNLGVKHCGQCQVILSQPSQLMCPQRYCHFSIVCQVKVRMMTLPLSNGSHGIHSVQTGLEVLGSELS